MSTPRLTFLYPMFYRPVKVARAPARKLNATPSPKTFSTSARRFQGTKSQRYGTAQEPPPHLSSNIMEAPSDTKELKKQPEQEKEKKKKEPSPKDQAGKVAGESQKEPESNEASRKATPVGKTLDAQESKPSSPAPDPPRVAESKPMDTVLHMPSPAEEEKQKAPHLKTPPYVHHFDTYGLVKDLEKSGFSQEQAVTVMKAVRGILTDNMDLAREGLVSKSNVENETYLFRAACSELRTEISNNRKGETEKMRTERNQLQHEVDILNQRMTQDNLALKDELKGLFDDRKMAVRQEQRNMETMIQELGYKITVTLNSDARSEVESLRWVLTRRAAMAIGISALMLFAILRYSSYMTHMQAEERKKLKADKGTQIVEIHDNKPSNGGDSSGNGGSNGSPRATDEPVGGELLVTEGGVSLG